ncbi:pteridine reductase [Luteimonas aestuarii]|uniref:pteridine reductase n=1 Tax=Luteimonas aestuarii TaxID=453837 RepID=UPI001FB82C0D|nr:pteridine reductase [Luteimonas aestuarii]
MPATDAPSHHPVALVTGAARRLGAAIARRLHGAGYAIAIHCHRSTGDAQALSDALESTRPCSTLVLQADLAQFDRLPELVARTVGHFGRLDALVNNAAAFFPTPLGTTTPAQWDALFNANVRAPYFLSQAAAPHLKASRGAILNLSDVYARQPRADLPAYATSKGALEAMTRALAVSMAPDVRVNAIAPGAILWPDEHGDDALRQRILARTALGRVGDIDEIAATALWLLRDAGYTTGSVIAVDGGRDPV